MNKNLKILTLFLLISQMVFAQQPRPNRVETVKYPTAVRKKKKKYTITIKSFHGSSGMKTESQKWLNTSKMGKNTGLLRSGMPTAIKDPRLPIQTIPLSVLNIPGTRMEKRNSKNTR
jgi:hypothetical protein